MDNGNHKYFNIVGILNVTLFILCFIDRSTQRTIIVKHGSGQGDVCRKGDGSNADHVCLRAEDCDWTEDKKNDVCELDGSQTLVCCPKTRGRKSPVMKRTTEKKPSIADDKCRQYSQLMDSEYQLLKGSSTKFQFPTNQNKMIFGNCETDLLTASQNDKTIKEQNTDVPVAEADDDYSSDLPMANSKTYPHIAVLGYEMTPNEIKWVCEGSLISEKWILTAAQCYNNKYRGKNRWARLGENSKMYKMDYHVIHPCYEKSSYYNDIALFRLEKEIDFSESVRPICLNTDPLSEPRTQEAVAWRSTSVGDPISDYYLLSTRSYTVPSHKCNESHASAVGPSLKFGILADRMICAGPADDVKETCGDDSGNSLQAKLENSNVYTLFGIQSYRKSCDYDKDGPAVYTRVSKYVPWIESVVWRYY